MAVGEAGIGDGWKRLVLVLEHVLDGTKRSETLVEVMNSGNTPKEQATGDQGQNGAGSNTSKEADAFGKINTRQPTQTKMSFKFESTGGQLI